MTNPRTHLSGWEPLALAGVLDLPASVERFRRWGDDLIDRWDGRLLLRGAPDALALAVGADGTFSVCGPGAGGAATMFVQEPLDGLVAVDPVIAELDRRFPGVRPVLGVDPLTAIVQAISAQQVNLRWACTTRRRLVERYGRPTAIAGSEVWCHDVDRLAAADPLDIRALQFTHRKAASIIAVARAAADGRLVHDELAALDDEAVIERLVALPGIGRWTAEWFLARTLGRPVVVAGDLAVRKAVGAAYLDGRMPGEDEVRRATAHWGAAAGVAQQLLLHALATKAPTGPPRPAPSPPPPRPGAPGRARR